MGRYVLHMDRNAFSANIIPSGSGYLKEKTVVIADDSFGQRKMLRELYESLGMICIGEAANGAECLEILAKEEADLISLDIIMPVMHGIETMEYLRENGIKSHIIFVTDIEEDQVMLTDLRISTNQPDAVFSKKDSRDTFRSILSDVFSPTELQAG